MTRKLLLQLFLLALPFITYFIYVKLSRRQGDTWTGSPWFWLVASGLSLAAAGAVVLALGFGGDPGDTYVSPTMKDGVVVPGRFE